MSSIILWNTKYDECGNVQQSITQQEKTKPITRNELRHRTQLPKALFFYSQAAVHVWSTFFFPVLSFACRFSFFLPRIYSIWMKKTSKLKSLNQSDSSFFPFCSVSNSKCTHRRRKNPVQIHSFVCNFHSSLLMFRSMHKCITLCNVNIGL